MSADLLICGECQKVFAEAGGSQAGDTCLFCKVGTLAVWEPEKLLTPEERWNSIENVLTQVENATVEIEEEPDELPIDTFVTAQRANRKLSRMLKAQYPELKIIRRPCVKCHLACLIAGSTDQVILDLAAEGKRGEVICHECCKASGIDPDSGGFTEDQVKELALTLMKRTVSKENAN